MDGSRIYDTDEGRIVVPIPVIRTVEQEVQVEFESINHFMMALDDPDFKYRISGGNDWVITDERVDYQAINTYLIPQYYASKEVEK